VLAALALNAWQSWLKHDEFVQKGEPWEEMVEALEQQYPSLPDGSRVHVRGGPFTGPEWQFYVLPAVADALWGGETLLGAVAQGARSVCAAPEGETVIVSYDGGRYTPLNAVAPGTADGPADVVVEGVCPPRFGG
jgi:hypothetical protein